MLQPSETQLQVPESDSADSPHDALYLVLPYLPVSDLLSASQVCTSFREAIHNDVLNWIDIHVDKPLSTRVTDHMLLQKIAFRANGRIRSLALVNCARVTDQGLLQLIQTNPLIQKLYLPGCTGLSAEGVLTAVMRLTTSKHKLEALKISNIHNITIDHLKILRNFITPNTPTQHRTYFHNRNQISLYDNPTCSIDIDECPKCHEVRPVFDCPKESCQCRGCRYCVSRCEECGECVDDDDGVNETACGDALCLKCWLLFPKCDFCNKAYCNEHAPAAKGCASASSSGFVCSACLWDETHADVEE